MFHHLSDINARPRPFECYTASDLWTDPHTSEQMLKFHLNEEVDAASRRTEFIERSVAWITSRFGIGEGKSVIDFGCGPGLYTNRLARTGADITGVDFSERSLKYARETAAKDGLAVNYVHCNYLEFETDRRFDLITMIMCDFCALSPDQRAIMLNKFRGLLKSGGAVLLDVYSLTAFDKREERATYEVNQLNGFWSPNKYYGFLNTFKYEPEKVMLDKYAIVEADRTRTVYNWLQYFDPDVLAREFAACGLTIAEQFADVAGSPFDPTADEFAIVAHLS